MEEIVIPDLDDDDDNDDYTLPALSKTSFGASSTTITSDIEPYTHHSTPSYDAFPAKLGTPSRPSLPKVSASYMAGVPTPNTVDVTRLGKHSNGSASSLVGPGTSISSASGFLAHRKGSLASLKNAFMKGGSAPAGINSPIPPVPALDGKHTGNAGYPALKNPFSRFDSPISPTSSTFRPSSRRNGDTSPAPSGHRGWAQSKHSTTTNHSSHRSHGGRSATSQGSSSFQVEDHPLPALPPIPMRGTPSRMGRTESDAGSFLRNASISGDGEESVVKTPAEEGLRVVFRQFSEAANQKIARICARPLNTQPSLPAYLDSAVDQSFDHLLTSLAHCSRRHARRIVELLSGWCESHCEGIGASDVRAHLDLSLGLQMRVEDAAGILGGRKSSAARYILNRALVELVRLVPRDALGEELGMSLEANAFNAYRSEKPEENHQSPHRKAVSQLQVELLGSLSNSRFLTVSDRFIRELTKLASSQVTKESEARVEARIEHLLRGMRHLELRVYPENELEMSADFLQQLAALFANAHGHSLKCAYAEIFTSLLHPVVETATAEVNHPQWSKAVATILQRALAMSAKPKYWAVAFPLVVVSLGVSPREALMQQWQAIVDVIIAKFKDRAMRSIAMNCFIRILWIYLNRCPESSTSTRKRLDTLLRVCFPANGSLYPPELPLEPFVAIIHYISARQLDYGEDLIAEFLKPEATGREGGAELPPVDRACATVRAAVHTLYTIELERPAPWPQITDFTRFSLEGFETSGKPLPIDIASKAEVTGFLNRCGPATTKLLIGCDRAVGSLLLSADALTLSAHASSSSMDGPTDQLTRKHGDIHVTYAARHDPILRLFSAVLAGFPRCSASGMNLNQIANTICRGTFSADPLVCHAAGDALRRLAENPEHCHILVVTYLQFVFETRHIFRDTLIGLRLLESQFERVVKLWLDLLQHLVTHQRLHVTQHLSGGSLLAQPVINPVPIDKIEGCALFLLCSTSLPIRRLAGQILLAARDLDLEDKERRPSAAFRYSRIPSAKPTIARVLQLYEGSWDEGDLAAIRSLPWCTSSDRNRLDLATAKDKMKVMQRIAESDNAKDAALWLSLLPYFVSRLAEHFAAATNALRFVISAIVLRLQGHIASVANASRTVPGLRQAAPTRSSTDIAVLADHWRSYLTVLCVTLQTRQPGPATPPVQRTREAIILTPDTIDSPALLHYLTTLLSWEDPRFRDVAVYALGSIGQSLLRPISEILLGVVRRLADGSKIGGTPREGSRGPAVATPLWTAVAHVFRLISPLILDGKSSSHLANLSSLIGFVKITYTLLADRNVKENYELQNLRRSFCVVVENLTNALAKLDASDRFLGEEIRGAIFKLFYEWCHVGRRPDIAKARESQTLQAAAESYRGDRDRAKYLDDLQAKTKLLSAAAAEAMAGLCQGKLISDGETTPAAQASDHIVEPLTVLRWIRGMFSASSGAHHATARKALFALMKYNWSCSRLLDEVLHQSFGEGEQFSLDSSFFGVVADLLSEGLVQLSIEQLTCLLLSKLSHPDADIRQRAFQLTVSLDSTPAGRLRTAALLPAISSPSANLYRHAQKEMAVLVASNYQEHALAFLAESTTRLSQLEAPRRQATLSILPAWLAGLDFAPDPLSLTADEVAKEHRALSNLIYLAIRFVDDHLEDIKEVLIAFAGSGQSRNTTALVRFLFEQGAKRKSLDFVTHAQSTMACLAQSPAGEVLFEELCSFVEPSAMAALPEVDVPPSPMASLADLDALVSSPTAMSQTFSTGQLALLFAGQLLPSRLSDIDVGTRLPRLLHAALLHCDHASASLRDKCQAVLFQVLRAWICDVSNVPGGDGAAMWATAELKTTMLARSRPTAFWKAEEDGGPEAAFLAPPKMTTLIMKVLGILLPLQPRIRQVWGELALSWATSCPIRHCACRSFQVFRILSPRISPCMVSDTLARLSSTVASGSPEMKSFNQEVIRTFASAVQGLPAGDISQYPQLFWCTVACLTTPVEDEYAEVTELLSHVLDKTNLSNPAVVQHLLSFRPIDWSGSPPRLQALLLAGLRSSKTALMTFDLIRRLVSAPHDDLIDATEDRLLHGFIAALPWMLHSIDLGEPNEELAMMALDLAAIADASGNASFSRLLVSFAHARFRAKDDFIRQASSLLRDFMPSHALDILTILAGFVLNSHDWMREKSMQVLKLVLLSPEARPPLSANGNELLQPLLRLVSTKHSAQALDLLDLMNIDPIPGSASGDIFGPIEESGWSVSHAKELSTLTRKNVTAVFNTCAVETRAASAHFSVVQFTDMRGFGRNPSQLSLDIPSPPTSATDEASMGDLVGALHSLNQFFDDGLESAGSGATERKGHAQMPSETVSERRVRAIMGRLRRPSVSSPLNESQPSHSFINGRPNHYHSTSELTESSITSSIEADDTQRLDFRHQPNPSMSSMSSDLNLFGYEEDSTNTSSVSIPASIVSEQSTPVFGKRAARFAGFMEDGGTPSPKTLG